jgi:ankyrin repeat protein
MRSVLSGSMGVALLALCVGAARAEEQSVGDQFAIAIERANLAEVKSLVDAGNSADTPIEYGEHHTTPLLKAADSGRRDIVKYLLSKGADPNGHDTEGQHALYGAASRGFDDVVEVLLQGGADPNAPNNQGNRALGAAVGGGHFDVALILLKAGAKVDATDDYGITTLMGQSSVCNVDAIRFLVKAGAKVNNVTQLEYGGSTPLTTAVTVGQADCVKELLAQGANPALKMKDGSTAISKAKEAGNTELLALLSAAAPKVAPRPPAAPAKKP